MKLFLLCFFYFKLIYSFKELFNNPIFTDNSWKLINNKNTDTKIFLRYSNKIYNYRNISDFNYKFENDKLILLTPGGLKGFYMLGTTQYIHDHYNLDNYVYSGASAGAWNALLMSYIKNTTSIVEGLLKDKYIFNSNSLRDIQKNIKSHLLNNYESKDFNFTKLFVGVTQYEKCKLYTNIYSDFYDLEDAINCCIASSHIPLITNGLINRYNKHLSFDGGFSTNPYISLKNRPLIIKPDMWNKDSSCNMFSINKCNLKDLYTKGYYDALNNINKLDDFFTSDSDVA